MGSNRGNRKNIIVTGMRGMGAVVLCLAVSACDTLTGRPYGANPSGEVVLPAQTQIIDPAAERAAQLRTSTSSDDHPELTGAPDARGRWPAKVGNQPLRAWRAADGLVVGSEGPGAIRR